MRKIILTAGILLGASAFSFAQFTEEGYKDLKIGMPLEKAEKVIEMVLVEDEHGTNGSTVYKNAKIDVTFYDNNGLEIFVISSTDVNARIEGFNEEIIGKTYQEVNTILNDKIRHFISLQDTELYLYEKEEDSASSSMTYCILEFTKAGVLKKIMATYAS